MIRQPPSAVPAAMVKAQASLIQKATLNSGVRRNPSAAGSWSKAPPCVPENRISAMMPIVFCASLVPWLKPMKAALAICSLPNTRLMT